MTPSLHDSRPLRLLRALVRAARHQHEEDSAELARRGFQPTEFDVVATLGNTEGMTMGEVARRMLASPPNVTRLVKQLEERGLVQRHRCPHSDRQVIARLTAEGEAVFDREYPAQVAYLEGWFDSRLDDDEQERLIELLQKLVPR